MADMTYNYHRTQHHCRVIYDGPVHSQSWCYWIIPGTYVEPIDNLGVNQSWH